MHPDVRIQGAGRSGQKRVPPGQISRTRLGWRGRCPAALTAEEELVLGVEALRVLELLLRIGGGFLSPERPERPPKLLRLVV